jgi:hypothetical protein
MLELQSKLNDINSNFFTKITPKNISNKLSELACSTAIFQGYIYLAIIYLEKDKSRPIFKVFRCNLLEVKETWFETGLLPNSNQNNNLLKAPWKVVHETIIKLKNQIFSCQEISGYLLNKYAISIIFFGNKNLDKPLLFISLSCPGYSRLFYSEDGDKYQVFEQNNQEDNIIQFQQVTYYQNQLYALASKILVKENLFLISDGHPATEQDCWKQQKWRKLNHSIFEDSNNLAISELITFQDSLYLATFNCNRGYQIWKQENNQDATSSWQLIMPNGAYRYILNSQVYAMAVFQDALYIVSGMSATEAKKTHHLSVNNFDIIRIYPDRDWDVIVGTPRITADGLKVPLSAMGPGFDAVTECKFLFLVAHNDRLYVGTQNEEGYHLWYSSDGETWSVMPWQELNTYYQVEIQNALSTSSGLVLLGKITELYEEQSLEVWLMDLDSFALHTTTTPQG